MGEKRRTNLTESEIVEETQKDVIPTANLPRGISGSYRDILGEGDSESGDGIEVDLPPPTGLEIKSQTIGFTPDGRQFVDVVIEFNEVDGASNYDVRITKV